jgi:hypothetical protein
VEEARQLSAGSHSQSGIGNSVLDVGKRVFLCHVESDRSDEEMKTKCGDERRNEGTAVWGRRYNRERAFG